MIRRFKPLLLRNTMFPSGGFGYGVSSETLPERRQADEAMLNAQPGQYGYGYAMGYKNAADVLAAVNSGELDPYTAQLILTSSSNGIYAMTEDQEKYFNNLLSRYQSQNALNWQAQQLQSLGLSNAGVLQTGAAHTAMDSSNIKSNKLNRANNIAQSMINMAGRMAASGIHGAALQAVKGAASTAASTLAHSASSALRLSDAKRAEYWAQEDNDNSILKFFENR